MAKNTLIIALTTVSDEAAADTIARTLVEERLAACVQRFAIRSTYAWEGSIEDGPEILLLIKSTSERVRPLRERTLELHPYSTPEFVVVEAADTAAGYLAWVLAAVADPKSK